MDNTDTRNLNTASAGGTPPVSSQPPQAQPNLDIAPTESYPPVDSPNLTTTTTTTSTEDITPAEPTSAERSFQPETTGLDNPVFSAPPSVSAPIMTPMGETGTTNSMTNTTTTTSTAMDLPTPSATTSNQEMLPKKTRTSPVIVGLIAILVLGLAGGGVFAVSKAISGQQAVAPTAPESEPAAFEAPTADPALEVVPDATVNPDEPVDCSGIPNTARYGNQCRAIIIDDFGNVTWTDDSTSQTPTTEEPLP